MLPFNIKKIVKLIKYKFSNVDPEEIDSLAMESYWKASSKFIGGADFSPYFYKNLYRSCLKLLRSNRRWNRNKSLRDSILPKSTENSWENFKSIEDQRIIELRLVYRYSWGEIAEFLKCDKITAYRRYLKITKELKKVYE